MNKDLIGKIDTFMNSKGFVLCLLFLLLVLIILLFSLGYSNAKLEEQIFERDIHIRNLQYADSIAKEILEYEETDSTRVLVTRWKNGHRMSYAEMAEERDSLELKYYQQRIRNIDLESDIEAYQNLEERISSYEAYIRNLQRSDSIAKKLLDYRETDSTRVLVTRWKNGHQMSYAEMAGERDSLAKKYIQLNTQYQGLRSCIQAYEKVLIRCQEVFPFEYSIVYRGDSLWVSTITFNPKN